jgi:hypothetical protein
MNYQESLDAAAKFKITARNYADTPVPAELVQHLLDIGTGGPFKQGRRYFDLVAIQSPALSKAIWMHSARPGEDAELLREQKIYNDGTPVTLVGNAQVLAPVLFAWVQLAKPTPVEPDEPYYTMTEAELQKDEQLNTFTGVGSSMGMMGYEANRLGLRTGNCLCFDNVEVGKIVKAHMLEVHGITYNENDSVALLLGCGYPNPDMNIREHPMITDHDYHTKPYDRDDPKTYILTNLNMDA